MRSVSITVCRRPEYTRQTIKSLLACDGLEKWAVSVFVDMQCEQTLTVVNELSPSNWKVFVSEGPIGCNENVRRAMRHGFSISNYHVHLEDDTPPVRRDALSFFTWGEKFGCDPGVFCTCGFARKARGGVNEAVRGGDYTAWGLGLWADRFAEMDANWSPDPSISWDTWMCQRVRNGRDPVSVAMSRIQNIGQHGGTYNNPLVWAADQHTNALAPEDASVQVDEWRLANA
jgi:hypothetical protein